MHACGKSLLEAEIIEAAKGTKDVKELLDGRPFQAFRMHLTNGLAFDIRHPDQCTVTKTSVRIVVSQDRMIAEELRGKTVICSLIHITHIMELD